MKYRALATAESPNKILQERTMPYFLLTVAGFEAHCLLSDTSSVKTALMYHQGQGDRIPAFLNQMTRPKPITFCTNCRVFGYNMDVTSRKCGRKVDGNMCKGTVQSAIEENDWIDCPSCKTTGLDGIRTCRQCTGSGWIFVRN
jgi:hypothetical protein